MKMNRRNALLGLGAIATGGGALFGSGAFSQVSATRSLSLSAAADSTALVAFKQGSGATGIVDTEAAGGSSNTIIRLDQQDLNSDAVTTWTDAIEVVNKSDDSFTLQVQDESGEGSAPDWLGSDSSEEVDFKIGGSSIVASSSSSIGTSSNAFITVEVDLTGSKTLDDLPSSPNVTFEANQG